MVKTKKRKNYKRKKTILKGGNILKQQIINYLNNMHISIEKYSNKKKTCDKSNIPNIRRNYCYCYLEDPNKTQFCKLIQNYYKSNPQKIDKIIHQIWIGPKKKPAKWLKTFQDYVNKNPDWKYYLWDDDKIKSFKMINQKQYDNEKSYNGKSDMLRYELLDRYGGIYVDADSALTGNKDLNEIIDKCNNLGFFTARECKACGDQIASGVVGCSKGNFINKYIIKCLSKLCDTCIDIPPWMSIGPLMHDQCLSGLDVTIFPYYYFYPKYWHQNLLNEDISQYKDSYMFQYGYTTNAIDESSY